MKVIRDHKKLIKTFGYTVSVLDIMEQAFTALCPPEPECTCSAAPFDAEVVIRCPVHGVAKSETTVRAIYTTLREAIDDASTLTADESNELKKLALDLEDARIKNITELRGYLFA